MRVSFWLVSSLFVFFSCKEKESGKAANSEAEPDVHIEVPTFRDDSAHQFVKKQVDFGPRIPGTQAHKAAGDYLIKKMESLGATVFVQEFDQKTFDGASVRLRNIIASFFPEKSKRILLAAHWDTRPFADKDKSQPNALFDGANDGASGVAVLLEIARVTSHSTPPGVGIDIIFFDGEDWGEGEYERTRLPSDLESWWCLGSQYWAKHKHKPNYSAYYGILLDMVGAKGSQFYRESLSLSYAPRVVEKVWNTAERLGYSHIFVKRNQGEVTDDHKFVTEIGKIPMIDIVNYDPASGSFGSFHHTTADNIDLISKEVLQAVGATIINVIYYEHPGA
ncbi:MAG TPA: M28 family peptidase [Cyclobacteriaceae bacterium]|nr:M28 family peptidase [Cyclobacteriaceae bacterium]